MLNMYFSRMAQRKDRKKDEDGDKACYFQSELLASLMNNIPDSIYFKDRKNRFVLVNKTKAEHSQVKPDFMIGKTDFQFLPKHQAVQSSKDDNKILRTGKPIINKEERITHKDGSENWMSVTKAPRFNQKGKVIGTVGISRDITERKIAQENLRLSEEKFRSIFNNSAVSIMLADEKEKIISWNKFTERLLGMKHKDLHNLTVKELYPPEEWKKLRKLEIRRKGMQHAIETRMLNKDGKPLDINISITVVKDKKGKILGSIGVITDISERKRAESKLWEFNRHLESLVHQRTKQIEEERDKVEGLLQQKTDFINQLSHDIRTPLTPIMTMSAILKTKMVDQLDRKRFEIIERNSKYLNKLVTDTLNLAKLDLGRVEFRYKVININRLINDIIRMNDITIKRMKIRIRNNISTDVRIYCDPLRIKETFENLLANSLKFINHKGAINFDSKKDGKYVVISMDDSGIGMSQQEIKHIFNEFYKADTSRHEMSAGLGLSICKRIVEYHKGKIWAESKGRGKGSTFFVRLPSDLRKL